MSAKKNKAQFENDFINAQKKDALDQCTELVQLFGSFETSHEARQRARICHQQHMEAVTGLAASAKTTLLDITNAVLYIANGMYDDTEKIIRIRRLCQMKIDEKPKQQ